jgi:hypothetical protein
MVEGRRCTVLAMRTRNAKLLRYGWVALALALVGAGCSDDTTRTSETTTHVKSDLTLVTVARNGSAWEFSGDWRLVSPNPENPPLSVQAFLRIGLRMDGSAFVSIGYSEPWCLRVTGSLVEEDHQGLTMLEIPEDVVSDSELSDCGDTAAPEIYLDILECLSTRCKVFLENGLLAIYDRDRSIVAYAER